MTWRDLYLYWLSRRSENRLPSRADFIPLLEIPELVPWMMMIDVVEGGFRVRLIGSGLCGRMKRDETGKMIDNATMPGRSVPEFVRLLNKVVRTEAPLLYEIGSDPGAPTGLLLPLRGPAGGVDKIMAGIFADAADNFVEAAWVQETLTELAIPEDMTDKLGVLSAI